MSARHDPTIHPDLSGKSVFVTGGGAGIGRALTAGFLRQGARVAFIGRSDYADTADTLEQETGHRPLFLRGDVTDTAALRTAMTGRRRHMARSTSSSTTPPTTCASTHRRSPRRTGTPRSP